jgi:hypothetical protein
MGLWLRGRDHGAETRCTGVNHEITEARPVVGNVLIVLIDYVGLVLHQQGTAWCGMRHIEVRVGNKVERSRVGWTVCCFRETSGCLEPLQKDFGRFVVFSCRNILECWHAALVGLKESRTSCRMRCA